MVRLCALLADRFEEIDAAYYQINILRLPLHRIPNMVYSWAIERVPQDKLEQWIVDLDEMLPWQDAESEAAIQSESDSFFQMQARGG